MSGSRNKTKWPYILLGTGAITAGTLFTGRLLAGFAAKWVLTRLMTEPYENNMWEAISAGARITPQVIVETNMMAESGKKIIRPFGGPKNFPDFSKIMFNAAQLSTFPVDEDVNISTSVTIGPRARRPMCLEIPILVSGMAYGFALSEKAKLALAKGATRAGTATNSGYGPFLQSERDAAKHLILQYSRGDWSKKPEILKKADAVEIQFGQGAMAGIGTVLKGNKMDKKLTDLLDLKPGEDAVLHARMPEMPSPDGLTGLVADLKRITEGIPVGVKIAAGKDMENDLAYIINAGADFIVIDGAQGGTAGSAPILQDDFGLPAIYALCRAVKYLEQQRVKNKISLIIGGGLKTPGDYLKALAIGADAVNIGTIALWSVTHTQVFKSLPYEPPVQVVYFSGQDKEKFDVEKGARNLANYLISAVDEMKTATAALGKKSFQAVNKSDLFALDRDTAEIAGIKLAW